MTRVWAENATLSIDRAARREFGVVRDILNEGATELKSRLGPGHWDRLVSERDVEATTRGREIYVVRCGGDAVATIALSSTGQGFWPHNSWEDPDASALCVYGLAVRPAWQRRGIGSWTMRAAEIIADNYAFGYVRLDAYAADTRSNVFYRSLGYHMRSTVTVNRVPLNCYEKRVPAAQ